MSSAYGATVNVPKPTKDLDTLLPMYTTIKGNSTQGAHASTQNAQVRIVRVSRDDELQLAQLRDMLNYEILAGDTYPQEHEMNAEEWAKYFLSAEAFVVVTGGAGEEAGKQVLGTFYIKPNFPGRCSHICNGGFIVHKDHRSRGVGGVMARAFLELAPALGYRASMFNLVFVSNVPSIKLWRSLDFKEIGRIPQAGRLRLRDAQSNTTKEEYVDAILFYKSFVDDKNSIS